MIEKKLLNSMYRNPKFCTLEIMRPCVHSAKGKLMMAGNYDPNFQVYLQQKDLRLVLKLAEDLETPAPITAAGAQKPLPPLPSLPSLPCSPLPPPCSTLLPPPTPCSRLLLLLSSFSGPFLPHPSLPFLSPLSAPFAPPPSHASCPPLHSLRRGQVLCVCERVCACAYGCAQTYSHRHLFLSPSRPSPRIAACHIAPGSQCAVSAGKTVGTLEFRLCCRPRCL